MLAYHFTANTLRDGRPIPPLNKWLRHKGPLNICSSGLHASRHPFDALKYAPGFLLHRVVMGTTRYFAQDDKLVSSSRKIIATINAKDLILLFARLEARKVLQLWDAPKVVKDFLKTGQNDAATAAAYAANAAAANTAAAYAIYAATYAANAAAANAAAAYAIYAATYAANAAAAANTATYAYVRQEFINQSRADFLNMVEAAF